MGGPIIKFSSLHEAYECMREWQNRLFLKDWFIKVAFASPYEMGDDMKRSILGQACEDTMDKTCLIRIVDTHDGHEDDLVKPCDELTMVHELLHCKLERADYAPDNTEGRAYKQAEHVLVEELARAFVMAKYGIDNDWFRHFQYPRAMAG